MRKRARWGLAKAAWSLFGVFMLGYLTGYHLGLQDAAMGVRPRHARD